MNTPELIDLLQTAVAAKLGYWDAKLALQEVLAPNDYPDNKVADAVEDTVSWLAVADNDVSWIGEDEVQDLVRQIRLILEG